MKSYCKFNVAWILAYLLSSIAFLFLSTFCISCLQIEPLDVITGRFQDASIAQLVGCSNQDLQIATCHKPRWFNSLLMLIFCQLFFLFLENFSFFTWLLPALIVS